MDFPAQGQAGVAEPEALRRVLVIVPAFNEHRSVGRVVAEVRTCVPQADVLVVDDGSSDETAGRARAAGALVLQLPFNMGVGGAMRAGYKYALRAGYATAVQVDADGQHDPRDVPSLLVALQHADIVIGARFAGRGAYEVRGPRRWAMRALAGLVSRQAGTTLTDVTSGFRACNRRGITLFAAHYPEEYLGDTVEALIIACQAGLRTRQVPVQMRPRQEGVASQSFVQATLYLLRAVLAMALSRAHVGPIAGPLPVAAAVGAGA